MPAAEARVDMVEGSAIIDGNDQGTVMRKIHDTHLGGGTGFCEGKPTFRRPIAIFFTRSNTRYATQADDQKNISD